MSGFCSGSRRDGANGKVHRCLIEVCSIAASILNDSKTAIKLEKGDGKRALPILR
jgi:hypothetical protein